MNMKRIVSLLLAAAIGLCCLSACREEEPPALQNDTLTVSYEEFYRKFSPFFCESVADRDVVDMTQLYLLTTDRDGEIILNGIQGEPKVYNGTEYTYTGPADVLIIHNDDRTVTYEFKLREDLCFSDGKPLTADDLIFTMYVMCDPTYDGSSQFASLPIRGLSAYRSGMTPKWQLILADTPKNAAVGSAQGYYTAEEAVEFWTAFNTAGTQFAQNIIDHGIFYKWGTTVAEIARVIGYPDLPDSATAADLFNAIVDRHGYNISDRGINSEKVGSNFEQILLGKLSGRLKQGLLTGESAPYIEGIQKVNTHTVRVVLEKETSTALQYFCIPITPLHYYGDAALCNFEKSQFGFQKGDLTTVRARNESPMGAGPYIFRRMQEREIKFEWNAKYYAGTPKTRYIYFHETADDALMGDFADGTVDIIAQASDRDTLSGIEKLNGGVLNGDEAVVDAAEQLGYGYIGISANYVKVGNDPASYQSKCLRKALATVFAACRTPFVEDYYESRATVIEQPLSAVTWQAETHTAFGTDVSGKTIYTADMTAEQRRTAASRAALGFFKAAGYTVAGGKVIKAPVGGMLDFEIQLDGNSKGNHAAYRLLLQAGEMLAEIGISLKVADLPISIGMWNGIRAERIGLWCAEWATGPMLDRYGVYFSGDETHIAGASQYLLDIKDERLNEILLQARRTEDEKRRAALYRDALEIVEEWAVEVPLYQRQDVVAYRTTSVDKSSVTPDITPYYRWQREIANIQAIG